MSTKTDIMKQARQITSSICDAHYAATVCISNTVPVWLSNLWQSYQAVYNTPSQCHNQAVDAALQQVTTANFFSFALPCSFSFYCAFTLQFSFVSVLW